LHGHSKTRRREQPGRNSFSRESIGPTLH
jgi:hypothetical protein